jgi:hypothetical protein
MMERTVPSLSDTARRLLAEERSILPESDALRARALSRAAASMGAASAVVRPAFFRARVPLLAAAALFVGLGAFAAYQSFGAGASEPPQATTPPVAAAPVAPPSPLGNAGPALQGAAPDAEIASPAPPAPAAAPVPAGAARRASADDANAAELGLLQRARAAVASGDHATALAVIAEHQRRFPAGRLREERDALRVKALASLGRKDEARRAADRFQTEFPRSVLSSSVEQTARPPR